MITVTQAYEELRVRMGKFRKGTALQLNFDYGEFLSISPETVTVILDWEGVELKGEASNSDSPALFFVRCQALETAGIFAELGAAVAEFKNQCAAWEAQHGA